MKNITRTLAFLFCFIILLNAQPAGYNEEFRANFVTTYDQIIGGVSGLMNDGFVVCWESYLQDGSGYGVYGRVFENDAMPRSGELLFNTTTANNQYKPKVIGLMDGGFAACWVSEGQDGDGSGIYGRVFDNLGGAISSEFRVNTTTTNDQIEPTIHALLDSGFVICWSSYGQDGDGYGIYGQIYENDGTPRGAEFVVNTTTSNDQAWPKVSGLTNSDFVVAWESYGGQDGDDAGVFARIFERDGTPVTGEFQVNTYTTSAQIEPAIIFLMDNGFIISWTSWYQDGSSGGVYAQIYEEDGVPRGSEFRVNTTTDNEQSWSDIVLLPDDEFAVCWQSYNQDGNANGVYLQLYNNDGSMRGTELKVNDYTTNNQHMPGISTLNNESLILAWSSFGQDGNDDGVYAKYYLNQVVDPLQAFSLLAPADESLLEYASVDFLWNSANILPVNFPWEVVYDLYLDLNSGFTNPAIYPAIVDTFYTVDVFLPDMDYYWRVVAKNIDGDSLFSSETYTFHIDEDPSTIVTANPEIPQVFELYGNFPNPFNPSTTIKYALPPDKASYNVKLKIFDALGELVMVLKDEQQGSGIHQVTWNGNNSAGNTVPSGVYFCVVEAGHYRASHKMLMIK